MNDVDDWRRRIDEIDDDLMGLIAQRAEIAARISRMKREAGLPLDDPGREESILGRLMGNNKGPLGADSIRRIFSLIIQEIKGMNQGHKG